MEIKELKGSDDLYIYKNSTQISQQTGLIGYLRGNFHGDKEFWSRWFSFRVDRYTEDFKKEFDDIINTLRDKGCFLADLDSMKSFCRNRELRVNPYGDNRSYGVRIDTEKYVYLIRLTPSHDDNNFYCWCYIKEFLDSHIRNAAKGIRFIDSCYNDKFRVPDGGKIKLVYRDGREQERMCRYIDPTHVELWDEIYHICELAEKTEENGIRIEPVDKM